MKNEVLYLIKSRDRFKIGYTSNLKKRINTYLTHNPDTELLAYKQGSRTDEKDLHIKYKKYLIANSEWMIIPKEEIKNILRDFEENSYLKFNMIINLKNVDDLINLDGNLIRLLFCIAYCEELSLFDKDEEGCFYNNKLFKDHIREANLDLTDGAIDVYVSQLTKQGFLIKKCKGCYMLNPNYFFKGRVRDAAQMSLTLEFDPKNK